MRAAPPVPCESRHPRASASRLCTRPSSKDSPCCEAGAKTVKVAPAMLKAARATWSVVLYASQALKPRMQREAFSPRLPSICIYLSSMCTSSPAIPRTGSGTTRTSQQRKTGSKDWQDGTACTISHIVTCRRRRVRKLWKLCSYLHCTDVFGTRRGSTCSIWEFPKIRGTLFWGPYIKNPTI